VISGDNLNNILKAYAVVNQQQLDYCQGMNFIAGFLFLLFGGAENPLKAEACAFSIMRAVIQKYKMHEMFNTELPMLKLNFYQLDRLISILLPDLHMHFKVNIVDYYYLGRDDQLELLQLSLLHHLVHSSLADANDL
jgi:hypothetical protein